MVTIGWTTWDVVSCSYKRVEIRDTAQYSTRACIAKRRVSVEDFSKTRTDKKHHTDSFIDPDTHTHTLTEQCLCLLLSLCLCYCVCLSECYCLSVRCLNSTISICPLPPPPRGTLVKPEVVKCATWLAASTETDVCHVTDFIDTSSLMVWYFCAVRQTNLFLPKYLINCSIS